MRHANRRRRHPLLRGTALIALAVLSFAVTGAATAYIRLGNNIDTHDVSALIHEIPTDVTETPDPEDPNAGRALNLLILGSDVRDGENALLGGEEEGMRSDTTIIAHISADRTRMELVSIPRDSRVDIPSCLYLDGTSSRAQSARFNAAFSIGAKNNDVGEAAACTINAVQSLTGIPINGWVVVDFAGFRNMVDALGGVEMCIPNDMESPKSGLSITAGVHRLDGYTALAYARARTGEGLGNGSDISRIARQQQLLGAIATEVFAKNLLTDSPALYRFLTAATESLTADPDTGSITNLTGLAWSLKDIPPTNITFMTVPIATNPDDRNEVIWTSEADQIWSNLVNDVPMVTPTVPVTPTTPTPSATDTPVDPTVPTTPAVVPTPGVDPFTPADLPAICG
jgi:LCP family protein required for cell wall assembly